MRHNARAEAEAAGGLDQQHGKIAARANAPRSPASANRMSGAMRFNASSLTKNEASIALSYPQNRTGTSRRVKEAAAIGKAQRHGPGTVRSRPVLHHRNILQDSSESRAKSARTAAINACRRVSCTISDVENRLSR